MGYEALHEPGSPLTHLNPHATIGERACMGTSQSEVIPHKLIRVTNVKIGQRTRYSLWNAYVILGINQEVASLGTGLGTSLDS